MKQVESHVTNFLKTLQNVESSLSKHIVYLSQVSTVQPHEGSSYAAQKVSAQVRFEICFVFDAQPQTTCRTPSTLRKFALALNHTVLLDSVKDYTVLFDSVNPGYNHLITSHFLFLFSFYA